MSPPAGGAPCLQTIVLDEFWGQALDTSPPKRARVEPSNLAYIEFTVS